MKSVRKTKSVRQPDAQADLLISRNDAARVLGVSPTRVDQLRAKSKLAAVRYIVPREGYRRAEVEALKAQRANKKSRKS